MIGKIIERKTSVKMYNALFEKITGELDIVECELGDKPDDDCIVWF